MVFLNLTQFITLRTESNLVGLYGVLRAKQDYFSHNASFWRGGLSDVVLSKYPNNSHNFTNLIFMTSSLKNSRSILSV